MPGCGSELKQSHPGDSGLDASNFRTGYAIGRERKQQLIATSYRQPMTAFRAPEEVDHRGWVKTENQGPIGSCTGNARTTAAEILHWLATGGDIVQFSRMFAYLTAQKIDGITGDNGATIDGSAQAGRDVGNCLETTFAYPRQYVGPNSIPAAAYTEGLDHQERQHAIVTEYGQLFDYLASGAWAVFWGIVWDASMANAWGKPLIDSVGGKRYGAHAIALTGYTKRKIGSRNCIIQSNSHGPDWGVGGHAELSPRIVDYYLGHRQTVCIAISDMEVPAPRSVYDDMRI